MPLDTTGYRRLRSGLGPADVELPQESRYRLTQRATLARMSFASTRASSSLRRRARPMNQRDRGSLSRESAYRRSTMDALARVRWSRVDGISRWDCHAVSCEHLQRRRGELRGDGPLT